MLDNTGTYQSNVFENADCIQKDRSKIDIYVEADGISYRGRYLDFVVLEKNKASATAYLKIAMANIDNSTTYISAYDSCGRICSPFCMVYNSNPPEYRPCSGVITNRRGPPNYCIKENANDYEHSCPVERAAILEKLYVETFKSDVITFIGVGVLILTISLVEIKGKMPKLPIDYLIFSIVLIYNK
jgi:hypothetical protein